MVDRHTQLEAMRRMVIDSEQRHRGYVEKWLADPDYRAALHAHDAEFGRMVATSTDPQWVRGQLGQPHQYSRAFIITLWIIGFLAMWGIFVGIASI